MKNPDAVKVILDRSQKLPSTLTGRAWSASTPNGHKSFAAQTESVKHKMLCKQKYWHAILQHRGSCVNDSRS